MFFAFSSSNNEVVEENIHMIRMITCVLDLRTVKNKVEKP